MPEQDSYRMVSAVTQRSRYAILRGSTNARLPCSTACLGNVERRTDDLHAVGGKQVIRFLRRWQSGHLATLSEERFERTSGLESHE